jgi:hypothetical protein
VREAAASAGRGLSAGVIICATCAHAQVGHSGGHFCPGAAIVAGLAAVHLLAVGLGDEVGQRGHLQRHERREQGQDDPQEHDEA